MWRRFSEEERQTIWDMREAGVPVKRIARHLDRQRAHRVGDPLRHFGASSDARLGRWLPLCRFTPTRMMRRY